MPTRRDRDHEYDIETYCSMCVRSGKCRKLPYREENGNVGYITCPYLKRWEETDAR